MAGAEAPEEHVLSLSKGGGDEAPGSVHRPPCRVGERPSTALRAGSPEALAVEAELAVAASLAETVDSYDDVAHGRQLSASVLTDRVGEGKETAD